MALPLRVLLVEDSEDDAMLLLMELRRGGWEIVHQRVDNAAAMQTALDTQSWDLIISDYSMPQFSGIAALGLARRKSPDLPFFLVSGTVGEETAVEAMKAGANDYLFKGNLKRLSPSVLRELREAQVRREARYTEGELRQRDSQLADAHRMARLGSWHFDFQTNVVMLSEEPSRMLWGQGENRSRSPDEFLKCFQADDRNALMETLRDHRVGQLAQDYRVMTPENETRFVHIRGDITRGPDGAPLQAAGMIQDITERKLAEQALRRTMDELAEAKEIADAANQAKDKFLAVLSHELRTPLTPVLLIVSLLEAQTDLPQDVQEELQTIRRHVELEARLIDDLLDLTRVTRGTLQLNFEKADIHDLIHRSLEIYSREEMQLEVKLELDAKQHFVSGDPARIQQVFWNLLSNAIKFTPAGGKLVVRTRDGPHGRIKIEFIDNGIGIDAEILPKLFSAFQQGDGSLTRKYGGLGLGLAIAKNLVDGHGGTLAASSGGKGQGSTFTVELATVAASGAASAPSHIGRLGSIPQALRILLVEDHEETRKIMARLLGQLGHQITAACSVGEALYLINRHEFDLLVSDIGLPDGSGHDVMEALRSRYVQKGAGVRGIAISGFGMEEDIMRSKQVGFDQHLTKPIDLAKLQSAVQQVTGRSA